MNALNGRLLLAPFHRWRCLPWIDTFVSDADSMHRQITKHIAMVRPIAFFFNAETAANDFFQKNLGEKPDIV